MDNTTNAERPERIGLVDSVLLIDGDNDPHLPADFPLGPGTLVRVFLRPKATLPRTLQRRLAPLPLCAIIEAPQGGKNAADFVMALHVGLLHASLPFQLPFSVVTNDKALSAIVQELNRVGRVATIWTSHPERSAERPASGRSRAAGRGRGRSRRAKAVTPSAAPVPAGAQAVPAATAPARRSGRSLPEVAAAYQRMLSRAKNPPSRLKALLNDITNRTANSGLQPADILEELKRSHGLNIDERGHVTQGAQHE